MTKRFVFRLPDGSKDNMISTFNLKERLSNNRATIYENSEVRFSINNKTIRVIVFDEDNLKLQNSLKQFFYGEEYGTVYWTKDKIRRDIR